jgi:phosphocarrier protein
VNLTSQYDCDIEIIRDGEAVDGKSILSIITLGAEQGVQLTLRATGRDAEIALDALEEQFANGFGDNGDEAQEQESQTSG